MGIKENKCYDASLPTVQGKKVYKELIPDVLERNIAKYYWLLNYEIERYEGK